MPFWSRSDHPTHEEAAAKTAPTVVSEDSGVATSPGPHTDGGAAAAAAAGEGSPPGLSPCSSVSSVELMCLNMDKLGNSSKVAYSALVAMLLGDQYREALHHKYKHDFLNSLKNHLALPDAMVDTIETYANGREGMELAEDFVESLKTDQLLKDEKLEIIVLDLLQCSVRKGIFDARSREVCMRFNRLLGFTDDQYDRQEAALVDFMQSAAAQYDVSDEEKAAQAQASRRAKTKRYLTIGLAAVGGGALIGVTGGLAAPLVAPVVGAIVGGTAFFAGAAGTAVIASVFGASGAGLVGYRMKRRVGDIEQFQFTPLNDGVAMSVTIAVPGWVREGEVMASSWMSLDASPEQYCLIWESRYLLELGMSLDYLKDKVVNAAMTETLKYTILSGVMAAVAWPAALLSASSVIDNPWSVAMSRSVQTGKQLAEVLLTRQHGQRPVTLVGVSLGAKVIYHCLQEMLTRSKNATGIIHNVIMFGAPCSGRNEDWLTLLPLISGKVINGYSRGDWLLKFLYRSSSFRTKIAGLAPIELEPKVKNVDLTEVISGHLDYLDHMPQVLQACGIKNKPIKGSTNKFSLAKRSTSSSSATVTPSSSTEGVSKHARPPQVESPSLSTIRTDASSQNSCPQDTEPRFPPQCSDPMSDPPPDVSQLDINSNSLPHSNNGCQTNDDVSAEHA